MIKKIKLFLLILGLLLFSVSIASLFFINFNFGVIIIWGISGMLIIYGLFFDKLIRLKWLTCSILLIFTSAMALILFIGCYGKNDNVTFTEDAAIVLGAGIRGEQVMLLLSYRLDKAVEYSVNNPEAVIVVSGGQGFQEDITEALAMERYLIANGVSKDKIIKEEAATSTYENLLYSKEILDGLFEQPYKTTVITNDFHIYRAAKFAEKLEVDTTHYHAKTEWYAVPLNYSRECTAVIKMWLLGI